MHVHVVLFDGFDPLDALGPYEVLQAAALAGGDVTAELVTAEGPREVPSGIPRLTLRATGTLDPAVADVVIIPGGAGALSGDGEHTVQAVLARSLETGLPALAKLALEREGTLVATVCGGSLILAMAGLISGRHATTNHQGLDALAATGARPVRARLVDDGDLVTAAGITSGVDLGLYLVERETGPQIAHAVETLFAHERRGTTWSPTGPTAAW
ncbi:DJ-1/PfpI family protein [Nonomuraea sp. NPDC049504]|uniref:DJ-1/PfpI family protein n=1 Tax=Nonomuraea sp. NPDC049504 TaxID=3154729 RepID=UPI00343BC494